MSRFLSLPKVLDSACPQHLDCKLTHFVYNKCDVRMNLVSLVKCAGTHHMHAYKCYREIKSLFPMQYVINVGPLVPKSHPLRLYGHSFM